MKDIEIDVHEEGEGELVPKFSIVTVHYTGKFENGEVFDSSVTKGIPFKFKVGAGQVIAGWDIGICKLRKGAKATFTIPPHFGYGANGYPPAIPPNATLTFAIDVIDFEEDTREAEDKN